MTKKQLRIKDIVVLVVFLAFAAVAIKLAVAQVSGPQPQRGDWLCWATSTKDPECGTECVVERAVYGPTSRWEAMRRDGGHLHDVFRCPHYGSQWHDLAHRLAKESVATASGRLRALIEADLDDLLEANLPKSIHTDSRKAFATNAAGNQVEITGGKKDKE